MRSCSDAHFGGERRLVTHGGRHTTEKRRHLGTCLGEAENVVNEEQHVACRTGRGNTPPGSGPDQRHTSASARRLVHLAVHQRLSLSDIDLSRSHVLLPWITLRRIPDSSRGMRSLPSRVRSPTPANTEYTPVPLSDVIDQLHNQSRFYPHPRRRIDQFYHPWHTDTRRSITLIPVTSCFCFRCLVGKGRGLADESDGAFFALICIAGPSSTGIRRPHHRIRPSVSGPTGTADRHHRYRCRPRRRVPDRLSYPSQWSARCFPQGAEQPRAPGC